MRNVKVLSAAVLASLVTSVAISAVLAQPTITIPGGGSVTAPTGLPSGAMVGRITGISGNSVTVTGANGTSTTFTVPNASGLSTGKLVAYTLNSSNNATYLALLNNDGSSIASRIIGGSSSSSSSSSSSTTTTTTTTTTRATPLPTLTPYRGPTTAPSVVATPVNTTPRALW
jgi:hypothetical protein